MTEGNDRSFAIGAPGDHGEASGLENELSSLSVLSLRQLKLYWANRWNSQPRIRSAWLLRLLIAWRIQTEASAASETVTAAAVLSAEAQICHPLCLIDPQSLSLARAPYGRSARALINAHRLLRSLKIDPCADSLVVDRLSIKTARDKHLAQLAFLAPDIQSAVLNGELRIAYEGTSDFPLSWADQRHLLVLPNKPSFGRSL